MSNFEGLLSTDYGFKPQGKSAPMAPPKSTSIPPSSFNFDINASFFDDHHTLRKTLDHDFSDLGGFPSHVHSKSVGANSSSSLNFDSIFGKTDGVGSASGGGDSGPRFSSMPVFDKPVYDDDVSVKDGDAFDDLFGGFGRKEDSGSKEKNVTDFDDLLQGYGATGTTSSTINRTSSDEAKNTSHVLDDPFVVLESTSLPAPSSSGIFIDPLEEFGNLNNSGKKHVENSTSGAGFDELDPLDGLGKFVPPFSADMNGSRSSGNKDSSSGDGAKRSSVRSPEKGSEKKKKPMDDYHESSESGFEIPSVSNDSQRSVPTAYEDTSFKESNSHGHASNVFDEHTRSTDDVWLSVSEIPLFTQPTTAPPPSRPPPPRPAKFSGAESSSHFQSPKSALAGARGSFASAVDELEDFSMAGNLNYAHRGTDAHSNEEVDTNSVAAAAAMKEAMDRAEARFRHARGVRERENAKASRSRESLPVEKEDLIAQDVQEREFRHQQERIAREQQREGEEKERSRREEEERRRIEKEQEEKEKEKRRMEREREFGRQAVERAAKEARERAAVEARARAERAAVQKAQAEARERAGRAAVQRVQAEARERAAAEAKERVERAAAEARERARAEAREKEAREKAAATARANQQKADNDLESFFGMGSRASSAPRPRASSTDPFESQFQSKPTTEATRTSFNSSSSMRKASSTANIVDDLSSIFGGPPSAGEFQEVEGETEERRRARLERHQRTQERAAKALAEKNARDLEAQREQSERHRIGETLDVEIKRWAAGKEGNLRALLSTLQYVLWPECGWQPVSLTDLITGAAVKKVYRKATLCIHPDKVQQKGASLQQKYVAEKVFDLLKEAWNKFNSEELF